MAWALSRRKAIAGIALACTVAPDAARALLPGEVPPTIAWDVEDVGGFDPLVRKDADGRITRHNLSFRTAERETVRMLANLDDILRLTVPEFTVRWMTPSGPQVLTMFNAYLIEYSYVPLGQQGRGLPVTEYLLAVDSTHGTLRRNEATQTLVADYSITPRGVVWKRYTA